MKIAYTHPVKWKKETLALLEKITAIVEDYDKQGYRMTLRQLYYQLVSADVLPNQQKEYARLSRLLTEARLAGLIDWEFIEDRVRVPKREPQWNDIKDLVACAVERYRRDRWIGQENYVEIWVEKDALSGVLWPIASAFHVTLMVNRGYSSATAMHDAGNRMKHHEDNGQKCTILYVGDHDPSGEDMVRDIQSRLKIFRCDAKIKKIALTMQQIEKYNPPPNPAKMSDPRAGAYIAEHGDSSWEVDALRPDVLNKLVTSHLEKLLAREEYERIIEVEKEEIKKLRKLTEQI